MTPSNQTIQATNVAIFFKDNIATYVYRKSNHNQRSKIKEYVLKQTHQGWLSELTKIGLHMRKRAIL